MTVTYGIQKQLNASRKSLYLGYSKVPKKKAWMKIKLRYMRTNSLVLQASQNTITEQKDNLG